MAESMVRYFPLFLLGVYLPDLVRRVADEGARRHLVLVGAAYGAVVLTSHEGWGSLPGFGLLASLVGCVFGTLVAVRLAGVEHIAGPLERIGRRTLPIGRQDSEDTRAAAPSRAALPATSPR
jgi:hypothetical protein